MWRIARNRAHIAAIAALRASHEGVNKKGKCNQIYQNMRSKGTPLVSNFINKNIWDFPYVFR